MKYVNATIMSGADTGSVTGGQIDTSQVVSASFQPVTGDSDAAGTVKLQASNDLDLQGTVSNFAVTNWTDITSATSTIASGVGPLIEVANMKYRWIRAIYTRSSGGSTTISVNMFGVCI